MAYYNNKDTKKISLNPFSFPVESESIRHVIFCECSSEALVLKEIDGELEIAIFQYANSNGKLGFRDRIRYCWKLITSGYPYGDNVVLGREGIESLQGYLDLLKTDYKKYEIQGVQYWN